MTRAKRLLALQDIDTKRDDTRARLLKIAKALRGNPAVVKAERQVAQAERALAAVEPDLRTASLERQSVKEHLEREETTLYGGRVRSPKEVQNLKKETDALRRRLSGLDDQVLELMVARDDAAAQLEEARADLADAISQASSNAEALHAEQARLADVAKALDAKREKAVAAVPPADLQRYDRIRAAMGGRAVAVLRGDTCGGCGMQLPRHEADRVLDSHGLVPCPGCGRILAG